MAIHGVLHLELTLQKVVIEKWAVGSDDSYIHTEMLFSPYIGESVYLNVFHLREDGKYGSFVTPLGQTVIERVEAVEGVVTVMCGHFGLIIERDRAFDQSEILRQVLAVIRDVSQDDLNVFIEVRKSSVTANVGVFTKSDPRVELTQLTSLGER